MSRATVKQLPDGVFPTMITPFLNDGKKSIDWNGVDREDSAFEAEIISHCSIILCIVHVT